ncbi:hypothetical protein [Marinilabilia salmonicolor]|uniref:hypothetical protein n=1 Tax=Marinilabilia salmonicolor TaxID=989 RepID=UPI00029A9E9E|nr:hypothetical protein [Marinilabilia salmonicolor]
MLKTRDDRYGGVIVYNHTLSLSCEVFQREIELLIEASSGKEIIWISIPSYQSGFIPILTKLGFEFHHCDNQNLMLA